MNSSYSRGPRRHRGARASLWLALLASLSMVSAQAVTLTLDQALRLAEERNPAWRQSRANLAAAQGDWRDAQSLLWHNPELTGEARHRSSLQIGMDPVRQRDGSVGLAQTLEIAGQSGHRRVAAREGLVATEAEIEAARLALRADVERKFVELLSLQERAVAETEMRGLVEAATRAVVKRVRAGEDSRLDGNVAQVELARADHQLAQVREQLAETRAQLATLLQLTAGDDPEAAGTIDPPPLPMTPDELLEHGLRQPRLQAAVAREAAAQARLALERAAAYPDVTVGLNYGREKGIDSRDNVTTLTVTVPLPLFRRNAGGIGHALSERDQAAVAREAAERDARADIRRRLDRVQNLESRVARLRAAVVPALEENQQLSAKALAAGEISLVQLLLVNRQLVDARRDLLDARTEWRQAWVDLVAATGLALDTRSPIPATSPVPPLRKESP